MQNKSSISAPTTIDTTIDVFDEQIKQHEHSKTMRALNFIYSVIVCVLSSFISKKHFKHHKIIGIIMGLLSYLGSKNFIKTD